MSLEPRQERFCQEYIIDLNATQAAIRAGYSGKTVRKTACVMVTKPNIQARISELQQERAESTKVTQEAVVTELARLGFSNMLDYVTTNEDGTVRVDLSKLTRDQAAAIVEVQTEEVLEGSGESAQWVRKVKFKLADKKGPLELLAKHLGMLRDKLELSGGLNIVWSDPADSPGSE